MPYERVAHAESASCAFAHPCLAERDRLLAPTALLAQSHLLGEVGAGSRVVRRHHRVIRRQPPFLAVLLRRHVVLGAQVALERLEFLSVLETNDMVGRDRLLDRYGGLRRLGRTLALPAR